MSQDLSSLYPRWKTSVSDRVLEFYVTRCIAKQTKLPDF